MSQESHVQPVCRRGRFYRRLRLAALCLAVGASSVPALAQEKTPLTAPSPAAAAQDPVKLGRYLAIAADCAACHTVPGSSKLFAGGYAIASASATSSRPAPTPD